MDMTSTMGMRSALLSWAKPPTSAKRSRSPNAWNCALQNSGVMLAVSDGMPSHLGPGISIFCPFWTKNWLSLFSSKRETTLLVGMGGVSEVGI